MPYQPWTIYQLMPDGHTAHRATVAALTEAEALAEARQMPGLRYAELTARPADGRDCPGCGD